MFTVISTAHKKGEGRVRRIPFPAVALTALLVLVGCTQGATGIFADIEQEVQIKKSNLVDNTFVASVVQADTGPGPRYFAVAGTKLFARSTAGGNWSAAGNPSGRTVAQYVAALPGAGDPDELYGVFARTDGEQESRLFRLVSGAWEAVTLPEGAPAANVTGLAAVDSTGGDTADTLLATVEASSGKRYLVVNPQSSAVFHEFQNADGSESNGEDLGANRPVGKAMVAAGRLWLSRNGLWFIPVEDLVNEGTPLTRVRTPANLGSFEFVAADPDDSDEGFLVLVTLNGGMYSSPKPDLTTATTGDEIKAWTSESWSSLGSLGRAFSNVLWLPGIGTEGRGRFLVSTISYGNRSSRGYFHADPAADFESVAFAEPQGNYRSTEMRLAGVSGMVMIRDVGGPGGTVFALTESKGLWATPSYLAGQENEPEWRWE
ncbi:MAG: hypothetical protein EA427_16935 [Spirochaetaceae bacterium]|nr:MAG: hypothetical protein EA427_16935 [Spirochaetaceae bacterium]